MNDHQHDNRSSHPSDQQSSWQHSSPEWSTTSVLWFYWQPGVTLVEGWTVFVHVLFLKLTGRYPDISPVTLLFHAWIIFQHSKSFVWLWLQARWCQYSFLHGYVWTHRALMGDHDCWVGPDLKIARVPMHDHIDLNTHIWLTSEGESPEQWCLGSNKYIEHTDSFLFGWLYLFVVWRIESRVLCMLG